MSSMSPKLLPPIVSLILDADDIFLLQHRYPRRSPEAREQGIERTRLNDL